MYYAGTEAGFSCKPVSLFVSKDILLCDGCCEELCLSSGGETLYQNCLRSPPDIVVCGKWYFFLLLLLIGKEIEARLGGCYLIH